MSPAASPRVRRALDAVLVVRTPDDAAPPELAIVEHVPGAGDLVRVLSPEPGREILLPRAAFDRLTRRRGVPFRPAAARPA